MSRTGLTKREAAILEVVADQLGELVKRIAALERRKGFFYRGVWNEHEQYEEDDFVTHQGSLWHCSQTTRQRPGDGSVWQLAVKKGRDAPR